MKTLKRKGPRENKKRCEMYLPGRDKVTKDKKIT
jgi:hypothetical protein